MIGLERGSYEAYCFDEAVWFLGHHIDGELEQAGQKPSRSDRGIAKARERVMAKYFGQQTNQPKKFADPALLFN